MTSFEDYIKDTSTVLKPYKYLLQYVKKGIWNKRKLQEILIFLLRHRN